MPNLALASLQSTKVKDKYTSLLERYNVSHKLAGADHEG
jgi:hypothetical protein